MPRALRFQRFLFEPSRFRYDPAVLAMCPEARGLYAMLFCAAWDMPEPGVLPSDPAILAPLAMATPEQWVCHGPAIAKAFDTSRTGQWIQHGLVDTHKAQQRTTRARSTAGKRGAEALHGKTLDGQAMAPTPKPDTAEVGGEGLVRLGVGLGTQSQKKKQARRAPPSLEISPAQIAAVATRFAMPIPEVELLAERVIAEAPQRGYRNAYSALLNWAKRERDNPRRQEPIPIIESPLQKQIRERRVGPT